MWAGCYFEEYAVRCGYLVQGGETPDASSAITVRRRRNKRGRTNKTGAGEKMPQVVSDNIGRS